MNPHAFGNQIESDRVEAAIRTAEAGTSGEIQVVISTLECPDALAAARAHFAALHMERTRHRNAVLIFIAPASQTFALLGDVGIDQHCGPEFWEAVRNEMAEHLKKRRYTEALVHGIAEAGELLGRHFPPEAGNPNELPDTPVRV